MQVWCGILSDEELRSRHQRCLHQRCLQAKSQSEPCFPPVPLSAVLKIELPLFLGNVSHANI